MKTLLVLSIFGLFLIVVNLFSQKNSPYYEKLKEPDLIFSSINQKDLNKMQLSKKQKENLLKIKVNNLKFSSF